MTFILGLTGSIGMGKSTTAQMFADESVPVWDADAAVHRLYRQGGAAVGPIQDLRPEAIKDGAVDRGALKKWMAEDPQALNKIERIVHPLVAEDRRSFLAHADADIVLLDIPLLFEGGGSVGMDAVVVVSVPADIQRARVLDRGTMDEATFEAILAKQMPDAEKRKRADYVIETRTLEQTRDAVREVLADIRGKIDA